MPNLFHPVKTGEEIKMKIFSLLLFLLSFMSASPDVRAAETKTETVSSENVELDYNAVNKNLVKVEKDLKSGNISSSVISEYINTLSTTLSSINNDKKRVEQDLEFVEKRIEALGPEPSDGTTEVPVIAQKRAQFNKEASLLRARLSEADVLLARIDELDTLIINIRNTELLDKLLEKRSPLIYPQNFFNANKLFLAMLLDIAKSPVDWYGDLSKSSKDAVRSNVIPVILVVALTLLVSLYLRLFIMRHFGYKNNDENRLRYSKKVIAAFFVALAYGIIPASLIGAALVWSFNTKIMTYGFFGIVFNGGLYYLLCIIIGRAFTRVTLTPYHEEWRLVRMSTPKAKKLTFVAYSFITMIGICAYLEFVAMKGNYSMELVYYILAISCAVKALSIILIAKTLLWDDVSPVDDTAETADDGTLSPAIKFTLLIALFCIGVFSLALFGYQRLSSFIFDRFIACCLIIGFFIILRKAVTEALHRVLLLRFWARTFKLRRRLISKIDFWLTLVVDPLFIIMALLILLSLWGVSTDLLLQSAKKVLFGFKVGDIEISVVSILMGIVTFFVTMALMKSLRRHIVDNVLSKMEIDDGIKHSLASGFGFVSFVVALLLAVVVMGGNLSSLALIAGALSVGIGLGLQDIVNNFVSGIILLFERPIKVGDWVKINGEEGKIKQINIRATEVETFNRSSVIIPNATLLSNSLVNLTHGNNWARYSVKVGVAYGSDIEKVKSILLECAASHRRVLKNPAPYVLFQDFGSSSLDFELRFYVSNIWDGWVTPSDVRFEINRRFIEEGIEIPFPQMVVHHGSEVSKETESQFYAAKKAKGKK